jgi:hypothetical protein
MLWAALAIIAGCTGHFVLMALFLVLWALVEGS